MKQGINDLRAAVAKIPDPPAAMRVLMEKFIKDPSSANEADVVIMGMGYAAQFKSDDEMEEMLDANESRIDEIQRRVEAGEPMFTPEELAP